MKKVFVTVANKKFLPYVKPLESQMRKLGKWDGDFFTIQENTEFIEDRSIPIHFYKMYLFHDYFKKYDWIFYCDLDVMVLDKVNLNLESRDKNFIYANHDEMTIGEQFEPSCPPDLKSISDLKAFQSCYLLFNRKLIEDNNFFEELKTQYEKYKDYTHRLNKDQGILNSVLKDCWRELGSEFVNSCPVLNEVDWDLNKLKDYFDDSNYENSQMVHFFQFFPPWDKNNIRFNPIWEYHKKCEEI